jgi:FlaA1/EpsC-like NDP-sugar epimerase
MYAPVGFVDDRSTLSGRTMMGLPIYRPEHLDDLRAHNIFDRILLAIPSLSRTRRRQILESLEKLAVKVLVVPSLDELASGDRNLHELREVQIEDLLDRDAVAPIDSLLDAYIRGKVVMITGAGGSIGSELCRQALKQGASKLVLYETGEYALYSIDRELRMNLESDQDCEIVPVLANVVDERRLSSVLREHAVETVYHAAAYKHVPLVEANVASAVNNNVFGTLRAVEAAVGCGVKNFVLVSTDKAVRPTNVMGASKRVCELIVQAFAGRYPQVRWSIVRFGNVLGSSGSVVPLFREQIAAGGPVTVTHPDVVRYFMTIPEAAQLVIQAGAMGRAGEVFVLDMGSPVRIAQLAERMVHLSGMQVRNGADGDVDIIYTGLRPGEKLYEELLIDQTARPSEHPRIYCADEAFLEMEVLRTWIETLEHLLIQDDSRAVVDHLGEVVDGFQHLARQRAEENLSEVRRLAGTRESAKLPTCGGVDLTTAHHAA